MADKVYKEIYVTKNYKQFKKLKGNRTLSVAYLNKLETKILAKDMLSDQPGLISKGKLTLDGQHRLEVAERNDLPYYYYFADKAESLVDVQWMNSTRRNWTPEDWLKSHIELGNKEYVALRDFMEEYKALGLTLHPFRLMLTGLGGTNDGAMAAFRNGGFKVQNIDRARLTAEALLEVKPYVDWSAFHDRDFLRAFMKVVSIEDFSMQQLLEKFVKSGKKIELAARRLDYLRALEDVYYFQSPSRSVRFA